MPAAQSFVPTLVTRQSLRNALALTSSANQVAAIVGPSIGGIVYAVAETRIGQNTGAGVVFGAAIMLLMAIALVALIRKRRSSSSRAELAWSTLLSGLRFVWHRKTVLGAISLDLFAVLFGGATALPAYTREVLHAGPDVFGYLRAAPGIGAGSMALWLAFRPISRHVGVTMFGGVATMVVTVLWARVFFPALWRMQTFEHLPDKT
jgi:MFS family permease